VLTRNALTQFFPLARVLTTSLEHRYRSTWNIHLYKQIWEKG